MRVSIHQPQYFPWLHYFLKIEQSDVFIILDNVDFQKNGLQNRNQIKTAQGASWLTVPVRQQFGQKIFEVKIDKNSVWRRKHWQTIQNNYKKAKSFMAYKADLETLYMNDWEFLCDLNIEVISMMLRWMDIQTPLLRSSQMKATGNASDLVLNLCLEVGATNYLSGHGGEGYLKPDVFKSSGIDIIYQDYFQTKIYPQQSPQCGFIHDLSMLDIILNCGESWRNFLHSKVVL